MEISSTLGPLGGVDGGFAPWLACRLQEDTVHTYIHIPAANAVTAANSHFFFRFLFLINEL
jgi:hypothetical protein